jgi:ATP-binding cassette subfamily C protein CydC
MKYWFSLLIKSQGSRLYWGVLWALVTMLSGISLLMLSGWFITATAIAGVAIGAGVLFVFDMYMPGSGIRFFALSRVIGRYTERIYNHDTVLRLIAVFRVSMFKQLQRLPMHELHASSDSEWLGKLTADLDALDSILLRYTITPVASLLAILVVSVFLSSIWLELAIYISVFFIVLYTASVYGTIKHTVKLGETSSKLLSELRANVIEHINGAFELHSQQLMQHHEQHMLHNLALLQVTQDSLNARIAKIQFVLDTCIGIALLALVFVVLNTVKANSLDGPIAVLLVMMFIATSEILQIIPTQFGLWGKTTFAANRLSGLMEEDTPSTYIESTPLMSISMQLSEHTNVVKSHGKLLSFELDAQQTLLVIGRSGCGKSTVADLLSGITQLTNTRSRILINGDTAISQFSPDYWNKNIAYLQQSNTVFAGSVGYNLSLGVDDVSEDQLWNVLRLVELEDWANKLPNGLNTWLGDTGGRLSGGQAKRLCLARLLLRDPKLLILDEPFNGVDQSMAARIWLNLSDWLDQRMVILLTHEQADHIVQTNNTVLLDLNIDS